MYRNDEINYRALSLQCQAERNHSASFLSTTLKRRHRRRKGKILCFGIEQFLWVSNHLRNLFIFSCCGRFKVISRNKIDSDNTTNLNHHGHRWCDSGSAACYGKAEPKLQDRDTTASAASTGSRAFRRLWRPLIWIRYRCVSFTWGIDDMECANSFSNRCHFWNCGDGNLQA